MRLGGGGILGCVQRNAPPAWFALAKAHGLSHESQAFLLSAAAF